jgi:Bacterial SCP ortholog
MAPRRRTDPSAGRAAVDRVSAAYDRGAEPGRDDLALAVRYLAEELAARAPGRSVEVRIPPYAAVQAVPGPRHTRGTPPAVVETDAATWVALATGRTSWAEALDSGRVAASGERTDLAPHLPLHSPPTGHTVEE